MMNMETICVGPFGVNCYLFWNDPAQALLVDPGDESGRIEERLRALGLTPVCYLLTHGHVDHVSAVASLYQAHPAPVYMHPADSAWAFTPDNALRPFYDAPCAPGGPVLPLEHRQVVTAGGFSVSVIHTPGHSPGGVCFHIEEHGCLFSGDTLFEGSVGRTDLSGGNSRALRQSLRLLAGLPDQTVVFPGHGNSTDLLHEKKTNYYLQS